METTIFEIVFFDGRKFRVNCENKSQKDKVKAWYNNNKERVKSFTPILNGIHSTRQFLEGFKNEK